MIPLKLLLEGYQEGYFPMALEDGEIGWFSPDPRGVLPLEDGGFRVPHGLRRTLKRNPFKIRLNTVFRDVMAQCAAREETWINSVILDSYSALHEAGLAHSVEVWHDDDLVGGLYGVAIGSAFFGESMFHTVTDASKVALVFLVQRLRERGYQLLDLQWTTPHLCTFGAVNISRRNYLDRLAEAMRYRCVFE